MTPEIWTIIGVGIALASLILASNRQLSARIERLETRVNDLDRRMAHLEGLLEGLREAIAHNRAA